MSESPGTDEQLHAPPPHLNLASGLLMGGADAVPGVSGGTIALIIGIYDVFIESLSTVVKTPILIRNPEGRARIIGALKLLVPLGIGVLISYFLVTKLLVGPSDDPGVLLDEDTAPYCYAFLFGLVLVSLREPWRRIKNLNASHFVVAAAFAGGAALFVGLPYRAADPALWMLALGGAGAIAVMLLPGVSGSLLLVILGQYATVTQAIHDRDLTVIAVFGAGMVGGVITFIPLLRHALKSHHDLTMAALTGLMAGSLRALWPYKSNYVPKVGEMQNVGIGDGLPIVIVCLLAGGGVVWLLSKLEHRILEASSS
jgi:putative membrane protein